MPGVLLGVQCTMVAVRSSGQSSCTRNGSYRIKVAMPVFKHSVLPRSTKLSVPGGLGLLLRPATCRSWARLITRGVSVIPTELLVVLASRVCPPFSPALLPLRKLGGVYKVGAFDCDVHQLSAFALGLAFALRKLMSSLSGE